LFVHRIIERFVGDERGGDVPGGKREDQCEKATAELHTLTNYSEQAGKKSRFQKQKVDRGILAAC
jgi:hypothetical protein